ncbi:hypothetical protein X777_12059 [Ooceraea biroi]|uniref:Uncharacterized protein n=1 Tax=Ooceraea biroi TaxID=2015173 RepID=A0A026WZ83_OOCBI|nr:hypothetical protein X777_12059 [Ooceraea biroi]
MCESLWDDRDKNGSTNIGNIIDTRPIDILMRWNRASITDREEWRTWAEMRRELRIR